MTRGLTQGKGHGRRASATLSVLLALAVASALVGCTQPTVADPAQPVTIELLHQQARDNGWHLAESALADGYVSAQELSSAVANLDTCLRDAGLSFELHGTNPVDGWRPLFSVTWPGLSDAAGSERASECTSATFDLVNAGYEISNKDEMDPGFMADVLACLDTKDYSPPPQPRSLRDLIPLGEEDPAVGLVVACVQRVGAAYPNGIIVAY